MHRIAFAVAAILSIFIVLPAYAQGKIVITQAKALAGNVTPGDTPGFPVVLSLPGAYIFESNLTVPSGGFGLQVNSNNVDIDMNGFLLTGSGVANFGVVTYFGESRIHDGVINRFKSVGMYIRNNAWVIEDMQIVRNGGMGIDATGARFIAVRDSLVAANNGNGIVAGDSALFRDNTVSTNGSYGIDCKVNCKAEGNSIENNRGFGIVAISGLLIGNTVSGNGGYGIVDADRFDLGLANNILIDNGANGTFQRAGGIDLHPNACVGKPC